MRFSIPPDGTSATTDLKEYVARGVRYRSQRGHNCNCTVLLLALHRMGLASEISGKGRRGSPFGATVASADDRSSLYIDVQGFKQRSSRDHVQAIGELMAAIARIGRRVFPKERERLFAHQFGDGFLVVSDYPEENLDRCAAIAIALIRRLAGGRRSVRPSGHPRRGDGGCYWMLPEGGLRWSIGR
ncbi:MAG: hypothetical protein U5R14_08515 [Gemmatimonadota bacterium]|nr:hypothetical protein [Gemmatimonadota bacterium]